MPAIFHFEILKATFLNDCINEDDVSALIKYHAKSLLQNLLSTYISNISYSNFFSIDIISHIISLINILNFIKLIE